ncbi:CubicO group peptidase (beta-lactamase class C family) [Dokdonella fugitiva]|uniref:CubicO group peptidase (Beta-lactamase class C family) n=2 Tax=Dokdonella fugitiva TaxID=328517 RepID=A0A4R2HXK5_9GAMM|nr:CubicO group peptidase (beta-lactamase class C family) [Dokdonella fugitiva]
MHFTENLTRYPLRAVMSIVCLLAPLATTPPAAWAQQPAPPESTDAVLDRANTILSDTGIAGASLVLLRGDDVVLADGVGLADVAAARRMDAHTRLRIGSVSKTFVAIAAMQLVEQGRLSLDAPVRTLAPELPLSNPWEATDPVRVVHLLEHAAGFDDMRFRNFRRHGDGTLLAELGHFDAELTSRWRPGERFAYANPGYGVAAYLIEKISGEDYRAYVREHIWKPLGMNETFWTAQEAGTALATGYGDDGAAKPFDDLSMYPAGAVVSTAADMAKLLRWYASRGTSVPGVLSAASIERMEHPASTLSARAGLAAGYGFGNAVRERAGVPLHGHDGGITGFSAAFRYSHEPRLGYVVMINRMDADTQGRLERLAMEYLMQGETPPVAAQDTPHGDLAPYAGWYEMASPRNVIMAGIERMLGNNRIDIEGDEVVFRHPLFGEMARYRALAGGQLRLVDATAPSAIFTRDADGVTALVTRTQFYSQRGFLAAGLPVYAFFGAIFLLLSSVLFAPVWLLRMAFGKLRGAPGKSARVLPALAAIAFLAATACAIAMPVDGVFEPNVYSVGICGFTLLFAALAIAALTQVVRTWRLPMNVIARWHGLLVAVAACGLTIWLAVNHLLGLRTWLW